jgi:hypothetical protein
MLIDQWLLPGPKTVHYPHLLLSLCCETSDLFTLNDRLASSGVQEVSKYGWAMAAVLLLGPIAILDGWQENKDSHSGDDTAVLPNFRRDFLKIRSMRIVNQGSMSCRREEEAILLSNNQPPSNTG